MTKKAMEILKKLEIELEDLLAYYSLGLGDYETASEKMANKQKTFVQTINNMQSFNLITFKVWEEVYNAVDSLYFDYVRRLSELKVLKNDFPTDEETPEETAEPIETPEETVNCYRVYVDDICVGTYFNHTQAVISCGEWFNAGYTGEQVCIVKEPYDLETAPPLTPEELNSKCVEIKDCEKCTFNEQCEILYDGYGMINENLKVQTNTIYGVMAHETIETVPTMLNRMMANYKHDLYIEINSLINDLNHITLTVENLSHTERRFKDMLSHMLHYKVINTETYTFLKQYAWRIRHAKEMARQ